MPDDADRERIPKAFTDQLHALHCKRFDAAVACVQLSAQALERQPQNDLQRVAGLFVASMTNSLTALGVLCRYGHGADAVRVARGMFENLVVLQYLMQRPHELCDYLDFDAIARWKRMQYYEAQ